MINNKKKIAVIGSGISGLSASYFLKDTYDVTLYEKNERLGGHSRTISLQHQGTKSIDVDTGFIVLNDRTYPHLQNLFTHLNIPLVKTEMSFAVSANGGQLEWSGTSLDSLFAQRKNILNPAMLRGVLDIFKFNNQAVKFIKNFPFITLGELIEKMRLKSWFQDYYILPMGGAIWSCPCSKIMDFPASTFVNFFQNHGLLSIQNRPQWYTLENKSIDYVQKIENALYKDAHIIKKSKIDYVIRTENGVEIKEENRPSTYYNEVIFSCHPTEVLALLQNPTEQEKNILKKFSNQKNMAYTHCDIKQMPRRKKCWSSWNYLYQKDVEQKNVSVTYWMNKLQHIEQEYPLFVTLNPVFPVDQDKIYDIHEFYHPVFDQNAIWGQKNMESIQGQNKLWFCGAYLRYGFHEDGIWSVKQILKKMNVVPLC